ncbi:MULTISPECIES: hypothetical protein [unclassified Streptomyces]|uniref:hypothetical protein n=1 Tax=unclassified Streptomyces TaxID=2593676 RepID=UPI0034032894
MQVEDAHCAGCAQHAELHKGNWGFGPENEPCSWCEQHAAALSSGCLMFTVALTTVAVVGNALRVSRRKY